VFWSNNELNAYIVTDTPASQAALEVIPEYTLNDVSNDVGVGVGVTDGVSVGV
jgi:hypothetical protein